MNVSLLIPVYPPDYNYIYRLLRKMNKHHIEIDIYLIFSSSDDYKLFKMKQIKPIIVDEPMNTNSIGVFKKMYGLQKMIHEKNDYIICIDCETDIIPKNFTKEYILKKINNIFKNKKIYGGEKRGLQKKISQSSANVFDDYKKLQKLTNDFSIYCWWSDLPVYKKSHLSHFFECIHYNENKYKLTSLQFEHYMYQYYLLLYHDFHIENVTPYTNIKFSLEEIYTTYFNSASCKTW